MNPYARPGDRSRRSRNALVSVAGLVLAVLAESCSVGLVGLSGWFIASSAVAGASAYSAFSYLAPSGGVRAFALGRIATNYANRVVLHSAAVRRVSAARLRFYDRAAAHPRTHGTWSGQSLDRVMADADTKGMGLIQATAPMIVAAAMVAGGCLAITLAGYPPWRWSWPSRPPPALCRQSCRRVGWTTGAALAARFGPNSSPQSGHGPRWRH